MSSQQPGGPLVDGPADPEHDPAARYGLEPEYVATPHRPDRRRRPARPAPTYSPLSGQPLAHVPQSSDDDVAEAFARARRAQQAWARTDLDERAAILLRLHDLVLDRQDEIIDLICWESGKARKHAFDEPLHIALTARYYGRTAHEHLDTRAPARRRPRPDPGRGQPASPRASSGSSRRGTTRSRWRSATGCPRCSPATPSSPSRTPRPMLTALLGAELLEEAGFPRDLWQVVAGPGSRVGDVDHRSAPTTSASPARPRPAG